MTVLAVEYKRLLFRIKLIVYALKIIGLAPFDMYFKVSAQINPHDALIVQVFQYSKIGLAYNILILFPVLIVVAIMFYVPKWSFAMTSNKSSAFDAETVVYMAESVLFILTAGVVLIAWGCKQKDAASVMNRLMEVHVKVSFLKQQPFNKRSFIFVIVHVIINTSLWVTFWARRIFYFHVDNLLPRFFIKLPDYIIYWFIIEYFATVSLLAQYLRLVNECLFNFHEFGNYLVRPRIRGSRSPGPGVVDLQSNHSTQLSSLKLIYNVRTELSELCGDVSNFFSLPILFCITCCFIPLVREVYVVSTFTYNRNVTAAATASYIFLIIFLYVYPVLSLSQNVTRTINEQLIRSFHGTLQSKRTGPIIHKLLVARTGREIKAELTRFSNELLHEDVQFTAHGFFSLESTLLLSMLGGAATYFVALMQFQSACTCESSNSTQH